MHQEYDVHFSTITSMSLVKPSLAEPTSCLLKVLIKLLRVDVVRMYFPELLGTVGTDCQLE